MVLWGKWCFFLSGIGKYMGVAYFQRNPSSNLHYNPHRIHGAAIYGNMDPINITHMLAYIPAPAGSVMGSEIQICVTVLRTQSISALMLDPSLPPKKNLQQPRYKRKTMVDVGNFHIPLGP